MGHVFMGIHVWPLKGRSQKVLRTQFFGMVNMLFPIPSWCPPRTVYSLLFARSLPPGDQFTQGGTQQGVWSLATFQGHFSLRKPAQPCHTQAWAGRLLRPYVIFAQMSVSFYPLLKQTSQRTPEQFHWISRYLSRKTSLLTWTSNLCMFPLT